MKTIIAIILAALAISLAFPACSPSKDDGHTDHTH